MSNTSLPLFPMFPIALRLTKMKKIVPALFLLAAAFTSCEDNELREITELDLKPGKFKTEIVIEGSITSESGYQFVFLTRPMELNQAKPDTIKGATVYLTDGEHTYTYLEAPLHPYIEAPGEDYPRRNKKQAGFYFSKEPIQGSPGKTYTLVVEYDGKRYTATDSMVAVAPFNLDSILLPNPYISPYPGEYTEFYQIAVHHFGYSETTFFHWFVDDGYETWVFNHQGNDPQGIFGGQLISRLLKGVECDTMWVTKHSTSPEFAHYIKSVFKEKQWRNPAFATIPASLPTNVSPSGAGFFYASDVRKKFITMKELKERTKHMEPEK